MSRKEKAKDESETMPMYNEAACVALSMGANRLVWEARKHVRKAEALVRKAARDKGSAEEGADK